MDYERSRALVKKACFGAAVVLSTVGAMRLGSYMGDLAREDDAYWAAHPPRAHSVPQNSCPCRPEISIPEPSPQVPCPK